MKILKITGFIALGILGIYGAFYPGNFLFQLLNGANILFHEAGHLFFMPFGQYFHVWGGTLTQLLIPFGIAVGFWTKRQPASAAVMLWWCGQNFFGISAYIKDARNQVLPFVGGEQHDWEYILNFHHLIQYDQQVGNGAWLLGVLVMMGAAGHGMVVCWKESKKIPNL